MNEIKLVIEDLKYLISDECTNAQCDYIEEIEIAIQALQEKAERENGCEFCNKENPYSVMVRSISRRYMEDFDTIAGISLNYCPSCGRKLEDKK